MGKKIFLAILLVFFVFFVVESYILFSKSEKEQLISSFEECLEKGGMIQESYPRRCITKDGSSFSEYIGNELEKIDLIIVNSPRPNDTVESPLIVKGEARGYWFFEGSFPVKIFDEDNELLGVYVAIAEKEWMTEEFVPFEAKIDFPETKSKNGKLVLEKDNPSGLSQHDDSLIIPIKFK